MLARVSVRDNAHLFPTKMEDTPEGYLLCRDVVLARTGTQDYGFWEVPKEIRDTRRGNIVTVYRHEDDVFSPATIESFRGRAFTDDHPDDDVGPDNYNRLLKGVVQNPRRGEGANRDHLVGDILVYDRAVIAKIRAGKREVSCGYDAGYEVKDGRAYQRKITGNHVSLVDAGRCGPACSIKDGKGAGNKEKAMNFNKSRFMDALKKVLTTKDSDETHEAALAALEGELPEEGDGEDDGDDEGGKSGGDKANHHHVTVNIGGSEQGKTADGKGVLSGLLGKDKNKDGKGKSRDGRHTDEDGDGEGESGAGGMPNNDDLAAMITAATKAAVEAAVAPLQEQINELSSAVEDVSDPDDAMTQDCVMRAEVLKPGFTMPTFDAKPGSKAHRDALVNMQRRVLAESFATKDGRECILPLVASNRPDFTKMPVGELGVVFRGASAAMGGLNNSRAAPAYRAQVKDASGKRAPLTQDSWNSANKDFWNGKKSDGTPAH